MALNNLLNLVLTLGILGFIGISFYAKFRGVSFSDAWDDIKSIFKKKEDDVKQSIGEVRRW